MEADRPRPLPRLAMVGFVLHHDETLVKVWDLERVRAYNPSP